MMLFQSFGSPASASAVHSVRRAIDIQIIRAATNPITYFLSRIKVGTLGGSTGNLNSFAFGFSEPGIQAYIDGIDRRLLFSTGNDRPYYQKAKKWLPYPLSPVQMIRHRTLSIENHIILLSAQWSVLPTSFGPRCEVYSNPRTEASA